MFLITRFSKMSETVHGGTVEGMTKNFEEAKEMLIKLQILASIRREKENEEERWTDHFVISHSLDNVNFFGYEKSYKEVMKE